MLRPRQLLLWEPEGANVDASFGIGDRDDLQWCSGGLNLIGIMIQAQQRH